MTDQDQLAAIKQRWAAATPGPWRWGDWGATWGTPEEERITLERSPAHGDFPAPVRLRGAATVEVLPNLADPLESQPELEANAAAIAAAPTDVAWLIAEVERLRGADG